MNFLAHSLFAEGDSQRLAGQFAGDFVRGKDLSSFSEGMQIGIRRHRFIDHYTDHHPATVRVRALFPKPVRRFAGIVTDVVFDHYLARDWSEYSAVPLQEHIDHVHESLRQHYHELPDGLQRFSQFIERERVLESNVTFLGVEQTLNRLSHRSVRFQPIAGGAAIAKARERELVAAFSEFFPQLLIDAFN